VSPPASAPIAPPSAVFVAASVLSREAPIMLSEAGVTVSEASEVEPPPPSLTLSGASEASAVEPPPLTTASALQQLGLEARIVATRAAAMDLADLVAAPDTPPGLPPPPPYVAPPPPAPMPSQIVPAATAPPVAPTTPEEALLTRLRVPVAPMTLAAARLAGTAASILPRILARLDARLASLPATDPAVSAVRTLAAFATRIDPGNARALPQQLMAYVSDVIESREGKLADIVRAIVAASPDRTPAIATSAQRAPADAVSETPPPAAQTQQTAPAPDDANQQTAALPPSVAAHVAERSAALQYDLKAAVAALADSPAHGSSPAVGAALGEALVAMTAVQLNVLAAQQNDPSAITIPLPVFYHDGGRPVQLRVAREAPKGGRIDADNFHISFVLDTRSLGTVAVDLQTVGRAVSVNVKTEASPAANRFQKTLDDLRGRLGDLHYRVAAMSAAVAPHRAGAAPPVASAESRTEAPKSAWDLRA
jgi:hypothetical protein